MNKLLKTLLVIGVLFTSAVEIMSGVPPLLKLNLRLAIQYQLTLVLAFKKIAEASISLAILEIMCAPGIHLIRLINSNTALAPL